MSMRDDGLVTKVRIAPSASIKEALKRLDDSAMRILFVCAPDGTLMGSLTDGDVRRSILAGRDLQESIAQTFHRPPAFVVENGHDIRERAKEMMLDHSVDAVPIVDENRRLVGVFMWQELFGARRTRGSHIDVPVIIMAGGRGTRLDSFTSVLPKPLIPIGEKPIMEIIMDRFFENGAKQFYLTLHYRGAMIQTYFANIVKDYRIKYIWEQESLGTAGSLALLDQHLHGTFIVSNCDIMVDLNYGDLLRFHAERENLLTVVGSIQHHRIPYGVITFGNHGVIRSIEEKPELDFTINTGVYVLSRAVIDRIPKRTPYDMPDIITQLLREGQRVGVYPVSQQSYVDIGQWKEYRQYMARCLEESRIEQPQDR